MLVTLRSLRGQRKVVSCCQLYDFISPKIDKRNTSFVLVSARLFNFLVMLENFIKEKKNAHKCLAFCAIDFMRFLISHPFQLGFSKLYRIWYLLEHLGLPRNQALIGCGNCHLFRLFAGQKNSNITALRKLSCQLCLVRNFNWLHTSFQQQSLYVIALRICWWHCSKKVSLKNHCKTL